MGFVYWLNPVNWFRRSPAPSETASTEASARPTEPASSAPRATSPPAGKTGPRSGTRAPAPAGERCQAVTAAGTQCKSSSREGSKYCGRHKGHRATPKASTKSSSKASSGRAKSAARRGNGASSGGQVKHGAYRLYQKGNRYYFSKKSQAEAKAEGAVPVRSMPADRKVVETPNGLPVLKKA